MWTWRLESNWNGMGYLVSMRHSLFLIVCCLLMKCLISDTKEHYRRYNVGTRNSGNLDGEENLIQSELPQYDGNTAINLTVEKGQAAFLHCKVKNQGTYMVSWARYNRDFNIVTIAEHVFIPDHRFTLVRIPGSADWTLRIINVKPTDAGIYECQIGTTPKMGRNITLSVIDALQSDSEDSRPRVRTAGEEVARAIIKGDPDAQLGQGLNLTCYVATSVSVPSNNLIRWKHNETHLNYNYDPSARLGHQIEIYQSPNGMFSRLYIPSAHHYHAGKYTCSAKNAENTTIFVKIHPSNTPMALHRSSGASTIKFSVKLGIGTLATWICTATLQILREINYKLRCSIFCLVVLTKLLMR